jgi:hypothetical protein
VPNPLATGIVNTAVVYLHSTIVDAEFGRVLFEIITAPVNYANVDVIAIEERAISLLHEIPMDDFIAFLSCTFQVTAWMLIGYLERSTPVDFSHEQIGEFLGLKLREAQRNIQISRFSPTLVATGCLVSSSLRFTRLPRSAGISSKVDTPTRTTSSFCF